jgi:D-alanyl-D-alanine carboxypeptidase/D-alanyl-D-alanine-endopeptidase (penicillin-binding protein 4)
VTPGAKSGEPVGVRLEPDVPYYTVDATAMTGARGGAGAIRMDRALGTKVLTVSGAIAAGAPALVEEISIADPAEYAAIALKRMLEARGVVVTGTARAQHRPQTDPRGLLQVSREPLTGPLPLDLWDDPARLGRDPAAARGLTTLMDVGGRNLGDDVVVTNKLSLNLHAEVMLRQLGYFAGGDGSAAQGARVVRAFVLQAGVDPGDFVFYDGSGLSGHDLVTPRAVGKLLQYAAGQPWFSVYRASLPVGGVDGSLAGRFAQSPAMGHVFAKTGTLGEARALSGYLECASGRTVTFSVMVTDHAPGSSEDRVVMDKIVEAIWAAN